MDYQKRKMNNSMLGRIIFLSKSGLAKIVFTFLWILLYLTSVARAGELVPDSLRLRGYGTISGVSCFIFDEQLYNVRPAKVVVEGDFRGWNHDMEDTRWWLKKSDESAYIWFLEIPAEIEKGSIFKFRIDDGQWMNPPDKADNVSDNNLRYGLAPEKLKMDPELIDSRNVGINYSGKNIKYSYDPNDYILRDHANTKIPLEKVMYIRPGYIQIRTGEEIDRTRIYYLEDLSHDIRSVCSYDGWFRHAYSAKKLGSYFNEKRGQTIFRIFAPRAKSVRLYLYDTPGSNPFEKTDLQIGKDGVWEAAIAGNLEGKYYDYTVHGPEEPGNAFFETVPVHITDPYTQVSVDSWGPGRIKSEIDPPGPVKGGRPQMKDVIAYEVHVQDFSNTLPVGDEKKGTFTGFITPGLKNSIGEKIGFDHIVELGVNVVHLQPIQEFMHYPDDIWQAHFLNDNYMIEQGVNRENYQWGYRTSHALAIESRFREKGTEWGAQNEQFRDLVQAFHDKGIAVIVDVVFNHTAERMDGRMDYFHFSVLDKQYYYRTDENLDFLGEYGTEVKSEERPMVQRWIIDQCKNLVDQYGIDGFRIDLAGQTDEQTLQELRQVLGPDIIIYGEPWIASADPAYENNPDWDWYKVDSPITFFQDDARNAFKGSPDNPRNKWTDRGFAGGNGKRDEVKKALSAGFDEDDTPIDGINYLDIHDNWALADRFAVSDWDGRYGVEENRVKIAAALLFTSLGPVVIHGGTEILRSKGHAPLEELKKKYQDGYLYFHGKRDTYNLATANLYLWENKGKSIGDDEGLIYCNYKNMYDYWRELIRLRKSDAGKSFRIAPKPSENYYQWIEPENKRLLGYIVDEKILVLINSDSTNDGFENIYLPEKTKWQLIADIDRIDLENGLIGHPLFNLDGGKKYNIPLKEASLYIWLKKP